jgi:DNA topoisomerase I
MGAALRVVTLTTVTEPLASAAAAGLRYTTDRRPGIARRRTRRGFSYIGVNGRPLTDAREIDRIRKLAIPPAWTRVWICPDPRGHLQATGRDARGRKQYRYHPRWREVRDESKYDRLIAFARALPVIRRTTAEHLRRPGLSREKVLATVVTLLERTLVRIGNDEYARTNRSFGLTTLRDGHVEISGARLRFSFRGKSGIEHEVDVRDGRLARIVRQCRDLPGYELFQYLDESGARQSVDSGEVNAYLKAITGQDITSKDFRTWGGTVLAAQLLCECGPCSCAAESKRTIVRTVQSVAARLRNTAAVCRKCYIHPAVLEVYADGGWELPSNGSGRSSRSAYGLSRAEAAVVALLQRRCGAEPSRRAS